MAGPKISHFMLIGSGVKDLIKRTVPAAPPPPDKPRFSELSSVIAIKEIHEGGRTVRPGARGVILFAHDAGVGYEVEFVEPEHLVISASPDELELAKCS